MNELLSLTFAILSSTVAASVFIFCANAQLRTATRKFFILLLYVNPSNWGTTFDVSAPATKREAFLIVWVVMFVITLTGAFAYVAHFG